MEDFNLVMNSDADALETPWVASHKLVLVIHSRCLSPQDRMISVVTQPNVLAAGLRAHPQALVDLSDVHRALWIGGTGGPAACYFFPRKNGYQSQAHQVLCCPAF